MNKKIREKALRRFISAVKEKFHDRIERLILFGSYARGDYSEESDVDVLVVTNLDWYEAQKMLSEIAVGVLLQTGVYISAKAISIKEFSLMKEMKTGFYQNISREGVVLA